MFYEKDICARNPLNIVNVEN